MRLYFMLAQNHSSLNPNPVLKELFEILRQRGYQVDLGVASDMLIDPSQLKVHHDLYILKSHSQLWLSLAEIYFEQGAPMLNSYPSCIAVKDKIVSAYRLRGCGIPTPLTWVTGDLGLLSTIAVDRKLVIKPSMGGRGVGIQMVNQPNDLTTIPPPQQTMVVQEFVNSEKAELKVYVIGERVFGIRKNDGGRFICAVSEQVQVIARQCGEALGLVLYGLDVLESSDGPIIIDVNYFPSYLGIPDAAFLLADYIGKYAQTNHS